MFSPKKKKNTLSPVRGPCVIGLSVGEVMTELLNKIVFTAAATAVAAAAA